jgi:hypothetical protein
MHPNLVSFAGVVFDPPLAPSVHRITLQPAAQIHVLVKDPDGKPVDGIEVEASAHSSLPIGTTRFATYPNGEVLFAHLPAGTYTIAAIGFRAGGGSHAVVNTMRDARVDVDLVLEEGSLRPAVTGVILDERGQPLAGVALLFRPIPSGKSGLRYSDAEGRFEYSSSACTSVEISIDGTNQGEFDPQHVDVPFGSEGVVIRRTRVLPDIRVFVKLIDEEDRRHLDRGRAVMRPRNEFTTRYSASGNLLLLECKLHSDWDVIFWASDHRSKTMAMDELANLARGKESIEIELAPGFEAAIIVRDSSTYEPIAHAVLKSEGRFAVESDARGMATLRGAAWPKLIKVERDGYKSIDWKPDDIELSIGVIKLSPLPK